VDECKPLPRVHRGEHRPLGILRVRSLITQINVSMALIYPKARLAWHSITQIDVIMTPFYPTSRSPRRGITQIDVSTAPLYPTDASATTDDTGPDQPRLHRLASLAEPVLCWVEWRHTDIDLGDTVPRQAWVWVVWGLGFRVQGNETDATDSTGPHQPRLHRLASLTEPVP